MIPDERTIKELWDRYQFPQNKRTHASIVTAVALLLAKRIRERSPGSSINPDLVRAAAMLHDIDKQAEKLPGERHPDAGVRILRKEGMDEVADCIRAHPLHMILDEQNGPKSLEEQIVFIADKMVKYEFIGVDKRFELWRNEHLSREARDTLEATYPKVVKLRDHLFGLAGMSEADVHAMV